jgi:RNA polymerase sigma-70 factor (ECF subfamily)
MLQPAGLDHLTEDLAQETFLRAFRGLAKFDPRGAARFSTWLLTIATRLAINELNRRRLHVVSLPGAEPSLPVVEGADRTLGRKVVAAAIVEAVGQLPAEHRAAFILREYEGLEYAEIAEILEIELGTVKSRLHRARSMLRRALAEVIDD